MSSPESPAVATTPSVRPDRFTLLLVLFAILQVVLIGVGDWPVIHNAISGVSVSAQAATTVALGFLLLFGILLLIFFTWDERRRAKETPSGGATGVPESLLSDWRDLLARVKQVYSPQSNHASSFAAVALDIRNYTLPQSRPEIQPGQAVAAVAANEVLMSVKDSTTTAVALGWAGWLLERYAREDRQAFWAAKEIIESVVVGSAAFADRWIGLARDAGAASLGQQLRDEWNRFREPGNLVGQNLSSLGLRTFSALREGTSAQVPHIREL